MNNEQKMYVVMMTLGEDEDTSSEAVGVTPNKEKALAYAQAKNDVFCSLEQKKSYFYSQELPKWNIKNPYPDASIDGMKNVPKWNSWDVITDTMREQRNTIKEHNRVFLERHQAAMKQHMEQQLKFTSDWMLSHLTEEEYAMFEMGNQAYWWVCEDVPML